MTCVVFSSNCSRGLWGPHTVHQDTPLPLTGADRLLSGPFSELHTCIRNTTSQREFEALLHRICEKLSIIEPPAKGEGLLSCEKVACNWWLARSCVQQAAGAPTLRPRQRPCHLLSPESAGTTAQRYPVGGDPQRPQICRCYFLRACKKRTLNNRDRERIFWALSPFS